jgi:hypothetical protein
MVAQLYESDVIYLRIIDSHFKVIYEQDFNQSLDNYYMAFMGSNFILAYTVEKVIRKLVFNLSNHEVT